MLIETAIKAKFPVISVVSDDVINIPRVLTAWTGCKAAELSGKTQIPAINTIYYCFDAEHITIKLYEKFKDAGRSVVLVNPEKKCQMAFDAGELTVPQDLMLEHLADMTNPAVAESLYPVIKGLSLKSAEEVVMLSQVSYNSILPSDIKRARRLLKGLEHGLYPIETEYDFYAFPEKLKEWLDLNRDYFLKDGVPAKLVPRGVMLEGYPGTGKSMAAKAIANYFAVPLYRLDISTAITKYQGESENRVARILASLEQEAPCVLLVDEVEKIFSGVSSESTGVITRILSQLLWWLAEHRAKIITVMTTNNLMHIPPELYRSGRIDLVMRIPRLGLQAAHAFALQVFESVVGSKPSIKQSHAIREALKAGNADEYAHADTGELVYSLIKKHGWL